MVCMYVCMYVYVGMGVKGVGGHEWCVCVNGVCV